MQESFEITFENGSMVTGSSVDVTIGAIRFRRDHIVRVVHIGREWNSRSFRLRKKVLFEKSGREAHGKTFDQVEQILRAYGASSVYM